jgi:flagellar hook-basal body complex protein FliE
MPGSFAKYMTGRKNSKNSKNSKSPEEMGNAAAGAGAAGAMDDELKKATDDVNKALAQAEGTAEETMRDEPAPGPDEVRDEGDIVEMVARGLNLSTEAAKMAADAIAGMPEFEGKSPEEVIEMIKGNYDLMKKIFESIAQTSDAAAAAEMNAPAPVGAEAAGLDDLMAGMM